MVESDARGGSGRVVGAEVGGLGEVVVAGCPFVLVADGDRSSEKYEVRSQQALARTRPPGPGRRAGTGGRTQGQDPGATNKKNY
jgi:hypothetical protein